MVLLRALFSATRVQHLMRCSPPEDHPALSEFDRILRLAIREIPNCGLSENNLLLAGLPICYSVLGLRRVSSLALPAFLASVAGSLSLRGAILSQVDTKPDSYFALCLPRWPDAVDGPPPDQPTSVKQSFWDRPVVLSDRVTIESKLSTERGHSSFLAATAPYSGDWLLSSPFTACGLRLEDNAVRIAVALSLGVNLCVPHVRHSDAQVDAFGVNSLICKLAAGRITRDQAVNDVITRATVRANTPVTKVLTGVSINNNERPVGLTLLPWREGKPLTWDVTVICPWAQSYVTRCSTPGAAEELVAS